MDIYSGYWGIDENTPERFMRNARIAGVAERADARVGDMRQLPFSDGEFDAVVSSYAIDHLRRAERPKAIAEVAGPQTGRRVPADDYPGRLDDLAHLTPARAPPVADPEPWRAMLQENGFTVEEEGTQFTTLYSGKEEGRCTADGRLRSTSCRIGVRKSSGIHG